MRRASTLFTSQRDEVGLLLLAFRNIPYLTEIRCLLDWMMSKTSLDLFQSFQVFYYHDEIFTGFPSNNWYIDKTLGEPLDCFNRWLFSCICSWILFALLLGPLIIFSEASPLVADNPVSSGNVGIAI